MDVGVLGCGYEHQLASIARALDPAATPENAGFIRPDAHLAIVLVTDEDDCSAPPDTQLFSSGAPSGLICALAGHVCNGAPPPAALFTTPMNNCAAAEDGGLYPIRTLAERVRAAKPDPDRQITVLALYADASAHPQVEYRIIDSRDGFVYGSSCGTQLGDSNFALRLPKFVEAFGAAGSHYDLCVDDLAPTAARMGAALARRLTSACLPQPADVCEVTAAGGPLPLCGTGDGRPCWRIAPQALCASGRQLLIEQAGALSAGTRVVARCMAE
jgi:hypothetical protein